MARMSDRVIPLRQYRGKNRQGQVLAEECYGNPWTYETYHPRDNDGQLLGWNGNPPNSESGAPEKEQTERSNFAAFRAGWERIFGTGELHEFSDREPAANLGRSEP
jgi:hypothetical protein